MKLASFGIEVEVGTDVIPVIHEPDLVTLEPCYAIR